MGRARYSFALTHMVPSLLNASPSLRTLRPTLTLKTLKNDAGGMDMRNPKQVSSGKHTAGSMCEARAERAGYVHIRANALKEDEEGDGEI